jgi:hypothetical protein
MGSCCGNDAPTPPNPIATAAAATGTNVSTAVANTMLNQVNQNTPDGSIRYDTTGNYSWTDPTTNSTYNIPLRTATQDLSPMQKSIKEQNDFSKFNMAKIAADQSMRMGGILGQNVDLSKAPARGDPNTIRNIPGAQTSIADAGQIQSTFGDAGNIVRGYGPADNFSADRQRVEDSLMARMNPQLSRERTNIEQRLADQGIRYGSQAYASAMDDYNRQANDARFAAVGQAGTEQQRMMDMAAKEAGFENSAQQQAYDQALGRGTFANQAQGQRFGQNATQAQFYNAGQAQNLSQAQSAFNADQSARNQYMQEQYAYRNQPINETSALLSGSQISQPNFINTPGSQIATTDVAGIINQNFQNQMDIYKTDTASNNALIGGLLGAAGTAAGGYLRSDRGSKENIRKIGTVFSAKADDSRGKLPIYEYSYKDDPGEAKRIGPMAQDVEKLDRGAVRSFDGVKHIDTRRVMGNILRAA